MTDKNTKDKILNRIYAETYQNLRRFVERRSMSPDFVEDILQEVYLEIYLHIEDLITHENYMGWIYKTADNKVKKLNSVYRSFLSHETGLGEETARITHDYEFIELERYRKALREDEYHLLMMKYGSGYTYKDIAKITGNSVSGSKMKLFRIVKKLRKNITRNIVLMLDIIIQFVLK